jgi:hypothetical protein
MTKIPINSTKVLKMMIVQILKIKIITLLFNKISSKKQNNFLML